MSSARSVLVAALWAVVLSGCMLRWDRDWSDADARGDGPGDRDPGPDAARADGPADVKVTPPDKGSLPDKGAVSCEGKPAGAVCRAANGACDIQETCDGKSNICPADTFQPATKVCRAAAGVCDVQETCTGKSRACPGNGFWPATKICRPSSGACDPMEKCTGKGSACPADVVKKKQQKVFYTTKGTDGHVVRNSNTKYDLTTNSVRAYCKPNNLNGPELARGFLSFDTKTLPTTAVLTGARLSGCFLGAPNNKTAYTTLYPATFTMPATVAIYNASVGTSKTTMPRNNGVNTFAVPTGTIKPGALTQYQLRWPVVTCTEWTGQVWSSASNPAVLSTCGVATYPWKLEVDVCGP